MKDIITLIHSACTEVDGSGELVPDTSCLSSTIHDTSSQPSPTLTVSPDDSHQTLGSVGIIVGSLSVAAAVLLLMVIGVVMWILIKKHREKEKEKQDISEPWSPTQ